MFLRSVLLWSLLAGLVFAPWSIGAVASDDGPAPGASPVADPSGWAGWARDGDGDRVDDAILRLEAFGLAAAVTEDGRPRYGVRSDEDGLRYNVFVRFGAPPSAEDVARVEALAGVPVQAYPWAELVYVPGVPFETVLALKVLSGVQGIELERTVVPLMEHALPAMLVNRSAALGAGARERWKVDGEGVGIAFIDTGIDQEHEAFDPTTFLGGYDATLPATTVQQQEEPVVTPYNTRDPDDDVTLAHGTHVASLAVANDPNGRFIGVAPGASFLDVKVIMDTPFGAFGTSQTPYGLASMVIEGLDFVQRYNDGDSHLGVAEVPVRVISMSIGELEADSDGSSVLSHAVNRMSDAGFTVVAAAGNCGPTGGSECCDNGVLPDDCTDRHGNDTIPAPGAAMRAITVGAMDGRGTVGWSDDRLAGFSSRGPNGGEPKPNVVAYGVEIMGAKGAWDGGASAEAEYHALSGTSMAAPFVAGLAALVYQANETLTPDEVKGILTETARDIGDHGWDPGHGSGVVNAYFAVGVALGILDPEATLLDETGHDIPQLVVPLPEEQPTPTPTPPPLANRAPSTNFTFGPRAPDVGEAVVFVDRSVDPDGHKIVSIAWDFGDGNVKKGTRVVHEYERPGIFKVRLTVTDSEGLAASAYTMVQVGPGDETEESPVPLLPFFLVLGAAGSLIQSVRRRT